MPREQFRISPEQLEGAKGVVGLPSRDRYNWLVASALDAMDKSTERPIGTSQELQRAAVFATLAQAEATALTRGERNGMASAAGDLSQ